ncbi:pilus assembly protein [Novosphingobium flavum]|uniref:Pilus assembly protein n=1 Tax=Novosphingobium flavum TaxID=1778672 RepID=A0A7X1FNK2_9SPHN|nr:TadE/TadG family type IV pilus assembly protein [Novosphingobium flavum]MBC2664114.1 pilus assembly protein [Novosphingobium flavum]
MIVPLRRRLAALWRDEAGSPAVEFALTFPALGVVIFGVIQLGMAIQAYAGVRNAVEVGARYASVFTGQANTATCGTGSTLTRSGYPTNDQIKSKVTASVFGVNTALLTTPTVTLGNNNGACYVDVSLSYTISMSLVFVSTPGYTMSYTRRVYQQ